MDANQILCLEKPSLLLAAEGAPVVFSTDYAHDLTLHIPDKSGHAIDLPATPDAARGGFVIDTHAVAPDKMDREVIGTIRGNWGFDSFRGPGLSSAEHSPGKLDHRLRRRKRADRGPRKHDSFQIGCSSLRRNRHSEKRAGQSRSRQPGVRQQANELEVKVPLKEESPGKITMLVKQYGAGKADEVELRSYSEAAHLDKFAINAGDSASNA